MWNSSKIAQGSGICTHTFWQHVSIIFCGSLSYDMGLSNEWVSSIFWTAPVKVRAAKMHCQLPASGNLSVCSLSSISGPPSGTARLLFHLPTLSWDGIFFCLFPFCTKETPQNKNTTTQTSCHITWAHFHLYIWNQDRKLDLIPCQPATGRNTSLSIKSQANIFLS